MMNLRCRVCHAPVPYAGRGAPPEMHAACRELSNDVARVARSLGSAWLAPGSSPAGIRRWFAREMFHLLNVVAADAARRTRRSAVVRLDAVLASLSRTREGRAAMESRGVTFDASRAFVRGEME